MKSSRWLRPVDLARMVGISPSLVRTYEQVGFLPAAERSPAGYRRYTDAHAEALRVARCLIIGYGWKPALAVMRAVHAGDHSEALALVDACHAGLHRQRVEIDQVLDALDRTRLRELPAHSITAGRVVRIGAAARFVGLRPSALRFWEQQSLLQPTRDSTTRSRYYDHEQLQRLRVIKLLRDADYGLDAIRSVLDDLATSRPAQARAALEQRRQSVQRASGQAMIATSTLFGYLHTIAGPP